MDLSGEVGQQIIANRERVLLQEAGLLEVFTPTSELNQVKMDEINRLTEPARYIVALLDSRNSQADFDRTMDETYALKPYLSPLEPSLNLSLQLRAAVQEGRYVGYVGVRLLSLREGKPPIPEALALCTVGRVMQFHDEKKLPDNSGLWAVRADDDCWGESGVRTLGLVSPERGVFITKALREAANLAGVKPVAKAVLDQTA